MPRIYSLCIFQAAKTTIEAKALVQHASHAIMESQKEECL